MRSKNESAVEIVTQQVEGAKSEYLTKRDEYVKCVSTAKRTYYMAKIEQCGSDQKRLFAVLNELVHKKENSKLPEHLSESNLVETINNFFIDKIKNIRKDLESKTLDQSFPERVSDSHLDSFERCTEEELKHIITNSSDSSCELDPLPTPLLKKCLPVFLPYLTHIVNLSLESGSFLDALKTAIVRPLLKKHNLDKNDLKNFRPVSNTAFVYKLIEKVVVKRLSCYMSKNQLNETFQSAYRQHHGTETALVKVLDDIPWIINAVSF